MTELLDRISAALIGLKKPRALEALDRERIAATAQLEFIRRRETVHFLGPPGTGKSHLATALGVAAVKAAKCVYRTTLAELTESLATAERQGRIAEKIRFLARGPRCSSSTKSDICPSHKAAQACSSKLQTRVAKKAR